MYSAFDRHIAIPFIRKRKNKLLMARWVEPFVILNPWIDALYLSFELHFWNMSVKDMLHDLLNQNTPYEIRNHELGIESGLKPWDLSVQRQAIGEWTVVQQNGSL